jgi:catechol 2,3-dioxygenase-like lactoylglutathione lyase family enzyme
MKKFTITNLDHIVLNVRDIESSLSFYIDVLGLDGERVEPFRAGKVGFPSVRINRETIIDLFPLKAGTDSVPDRQAGANLNHFCMVVAPADFDGVLAELKHRSVKVNEGPVSRWGAQGQATSVYFADPDDNVIEIRCYGKPE